MDETTAIQLTLSAIVGFVLGTIARRLDAGRESRWAKGAHVSGIGGVFFRAENPEKLREWYRERLGIDAGEHGINFFWREVDNRGRFGRTVWSVFPRNTTYFGPGDQEVMINYRVRDLKALLSELRKHGVPQIGQTEEYWYGRFAWVTDIEGNRVELWEPITFSPREFEDRMRRETKSR